MISIPMWVLPSTVVAIFIIGVSIGLFTSKYMSRDGCREIRKIRDANGQKWMAEIKETIGKLFGKHDETMAELNKINICIAGLQK